MKNYTETINLPRTSFQMKANLREKEPKILNYWDRIKLYKLVLEKNKNSQKFILHDGPPYANAPIHMGHALNKILKDFIVKYKSMRGFYTPFIVGWDCHGLPIEHQLLKELKIKKEEISCIEFRKKAKEYVKKFIEIQRNEFMRLGILADWEKPYLTIDKNYESKILESFKKLVEKNYIYRKKKIVYWCTNCQTALAEAEVEYKDKTSPSIYVKFKILRPTSAISDIKEEIWALLWTTTPWTLPANLAIAFHPDENYSIVNFSDGLFLLSKMSLENVANLKNEKPTIIKEISGKNLGKTHPASEEYLICQHPFLERESIAITDPGVDPKEGTGIVHIAPGHGEEDYYLGNIYGLDIFSPVDEKGKFTDEIRELQGIDVYESNSIIIEKMETRGTLFFKTEVTHSYPHCWRCKFPIIFRAAKQWFCKIDEIRKDLLNQIDRVKWVPPYGKNRIYSMVESRPDWCLSRQRYWGVPIPVVYCTECGEALLIPELIEKFERIVKEEGTDSWYTYPLDRFLPEGIRCRSCGNTKFNKGQEILDVWFDSGVSYEAVLRENPELSYPCDLYLEGSDQHRGWFQTSLIPSVAIYGVPPYKSVLTHGFVVDGEGKKMSKSLGNVISPQDVIVEYGAEILRLWVAFSDYREDVRLSKQILEKIVITYRKIRNTIKFLLGNLYDFNRNESVEYEELQEIDKYMLHELQLFLKNITDYYEKYEFFKVVHKLEEFCVVLLSNFYLDILKDRLYTFHPNSKERKSAQTTIYEILMVLLKISAPVISFTAEEAYLVLRESFTDLKGSIFLEDFPRYEERFLNHELASRWEKLIEIKDKVNSHLEIARKSKKLASSLEAKVIIHVPDKKTYEFLKSYENQLPTLFITSQVEIKQDPQLEETKFDIKHADGEKCQRCWNWSKTVKDGICKRCSEVLEKLWFSRSDF